MAVAAASTVCLTASYVATDERARLLRRMCTSISVQRHTPLDLAYHVGITGLNDEDVAELSAEFKMIVFHNYDVDRMAQFQVYNKLAEDVLTANVEWVMFSDDDDIWHPDRGVSCTTLVAEHMVSDKLYVCCHASLLLTGIVRMCYRWPPVVRQNWFPALCLTPLQQAMGAICGVLKMSIAHSPVAP